jgi:hypothetical protein
MKARTGMLGSMPLGVPSAPLLVPSVTPPMLAARLGPASANVASTCMAG